MANGLPGMPAQMPKFVLPRTEIMSQSPITALAEVRTSFSNTLANIEAALPAPGAVGAPGATALALPKLEEFFKGPAAAMKEIQTSLSTLMPGAPAAAPAAPPAAPAAAPAAPPAATPAITGRRQQTVLRGLR